MSHHTRITAHRGFRDVFPQNTVAAMEGTSRLGADRIEIDIVATADGDIVTFHDASLDRLTDETGVVGETPTETVLAAEILDSGETIPTLAETLAAVDPSITMNIEFKENGPLSWTEFAERTLEIADGYSGEFYTSSFDPDALRAVREVDESVDVAPIFGSDPEANLEIARELDAEAINCSTGVLDEDLVETVHEEGREVNVWTIDSWREAQGPLALGVDGLIADFPYMALGNGEPNPTVRVDSLAMSNGNTGTARLEARWLFDGLSGGTVTLSLSNPEVGSISGATVADVFGLSETSLAADGSSVTIRFADLDSNVQDVLGNSDVHLADVEIDGDATGTTDLEVTVDQFDDEAGDSPTTSTKHGVIVVGPPAVGGGATPTDPDGDGLYEDVNGNGRLDYADIELLFEHLDAESVTMNVDAYDINENGQLDYDDIVELYEAV